MKFDIQAIWLLHTCPPGSNVSVIVCIYFSAKKVVGRYAYMYAHKNCVCIADFYFTMNASIATSSVMMMMMMMLLLINFHSPSFSISSFFRYFSISNFLQWKFSCKKQNVNCIIKKRRRRRNYIHTSTQTHCNIITFNLDCFSAHVYI